MVTIMRLLLLILSLGLITSPVNAAGTNVVRYPSGTPVNVCATSDIGCYAGESVNKDWQLAIPSPAALTASTVEVDEMCNFQGNLYIAYDNAQLNSNTTAPIYKWDGKTNSLFYEIGKGLDFQSVVPCEEYNNKLFVGTAGQSNGQGNVYVYDPKLTPSNFVQFPTTNSSNSTAAVTVPNDSSNNAIFGSTSYSVEFYGRIDDNGVLGPGKIVNKRNSSGTSGYSFELAATKSISVAIRESGGTRTTTTNTNAFTLGALHDVIFSWTAGAAPKIYIDGIESSYATSTAATTPISDTGDLMYFGNSIANSRYLAGTFRRVRIWRNYAITGADAISLSSGGSAASSPTGEYLFTEGSGTSIADTSGNNNTGTLISPAYWNNTTFDLSFANGAHQFIYSLRKFKGNLYAGSGFSASAVAIYKFNGSTWSTAWTGAINGPSTAGIVFDMWSYKERLFASLSGSGGAIISTPDGVTWTTEINLNGTGTGFTHFAEFKGRLFASRFDTSNELYVRNDATATWSPIFSDTSHNINQCDALGVYNSAIYLGCTNTTASGVSAMVFKSYDGYTFTLDLTLSSGTSTPIPTEVFSMTNYNGSLYVGMGFHTANGDIWRKTDSLGQLTDNIDRFIRRFYGNINQSVNWSEDDAIVNVTPPWNFKSLVSFADNGINWDNISNIGPNQNINWNSVTGSSIGRVLERTATGVNWSDMSSGGGAGDMTKAVYDPAAILQQLVGINAVQTVTNKRNTKRIVTAADATSITPNSDNADVTYQLNTQALGTLTINADGGTPTNGQSWVLKIKSTNVQTFSWNAVFVGGTVALPTATTGGSKIDYYCFIYDTVNSKWQYTGTSQGF